MVGPADRVRDMKNFIRCIVIVLAFFTVVCSCSSKSSFPAEEEALPEPSQPPQDTTANVEQDTTPVELILSSKSFGDGDAIPVRYTCAGENLSPQLAWTGVPATTVSFVLILDDPDAPRGVFTHWIAFNIPSDINELEEGMGNAVPPDFGVLFGKNDMKKDMYGGPCPPPGSPHHYRFTLYAIDAALGLDEGASKQQVLEAMNGHIIQESILTGIFKR